MMYGELGRVACGVHVHIQRSSIRLLQSTLCIQIVAEKLVAVFGDTSIYEDAIDAAELCISGREAGALGCPGCDVAGLEECFSGVMLERRWWWLQVQKNEVVGWV
jgi:hypothetical protein